MIHHLLGCNEFFVQLAAYARSEPEVTLVRWWSERRATAAIGGVARPDGHGIWSADGHRAPFWLEYDTGTESMRQLADKLPGYLRLVDTPWNFPVLFRLPSPTRENTLHRVFSDRVPDGLIVATTIGSLSEGAAGAVWRIVDSGAAADTRRRLIDLPTARNTSFKPDQVA